MFWLWIGIGAAATVAALILYVLIANFIDDRASSRRAVIRQRQYDAEAAMVRTVQNTIAEMFDTVRRQR